MKHTKQAHAQHAQQEAWPNSVIFGRFDNFCEITIGRVAVKKIKPPLPTGESIVIYFQIFFSARSTIGNC